MVEPSTVASAPSRLIRSNQSRFGSRGRSKSRTTVDILQRKSTIPHPLPFVKPSVKEKSSKIYNNGRNWHRENGARRRFEPDMQKYIHRKEDEDEASVEATTRRRRAFEPSSKNFTSGRTPMFWDDRQETEERENDRHAKLKRFQSPIEPSPFLTSEKTNTHDNLSHQRSHKTIKKGEGKKEFCFSTKLSSKLQPTRPRKQDPDGRVVSMVPFSVVQNLHTPKCREKSTFQEETYYEEEQELSSQQHYHQMVVVPSLVDNMSRTTVDSSMQMNFLDKDDFSIVSPPVQWTGKDSWLRRRKRFQQWGIPLPPTLQTLRASHINHPSIHDSTIPDDLDCQYLTDQKYHNTLEQTLRERLVWIRYQGKYWWPAIVYDDHYRQILEDPALCEHVWKRVSLWKRWQIACKVALSIATPTASMAKSANLGDKRIRVARVFGRGGGGSGNGSGGNLELIEMHQGQGPDHQTFPIDAEQPVQEAMNHMVLNKDYFSQDPHLYLDWHRAMDEMEELLHQCVGESASVRAARRRKQQAAKRAKKNQEVVDNGSKVAVKKALARADRHAARANETTDTYGEYIDENSLLDLSLADALTIDSLSKTGGRSPDQLNDEVQRQSWLVHAQEAERQRMMESCQSCMTIFCAVMSCGLKNTHEEKDLTLSSHEACVNEAASVVDILDGK